MQVIYGSYKRAGNDLFTVKYSGGVHRYLSLAITKKDDPSNDESSLQLSLLSSINLH